jgi:hypothetical protein
VHAATLAVVLSKVAAVDRLPVAESL